MSIKKIIGGGTELPIVLKNRAYFLFHNVKFGSNVKAKGKIYVVNKGSISVGSDSILNGGNKFNPIGFDGCTNLITERNGTIVIGKRFGMSNSTIYSRVGITIGDDVMLGAGVKIYDTDFHSLDARYRGTPEDKSHTCNKPINIGSHVFVGAGTMILKGVTIGDNAVISAGSIVTKDVPANEIWAGNPAARIKLIHMEE